MRCFLAALAISACVVPGLSRAEDQTPNPPPTASTTADKPQNPDDELICRRAQLTGSLLPGPKICKTRKIWREEQQNAKDLLNNATTRSLQASPPGG